MILRERERERERAELGGSRGRVFVYYVMYGREERPGAGEEAPSRLKSFRRIHVGISTYFQSATVFEFQAQLSIALLVVSKLITS